MPYVYGFDRGEIATSPKIYKVEISDSLYKKLTSSCLNRQGVICESNVDNLPDCFVWFAKYENAKSELVFLLDIEHRQAVRKAEEVYDKIFLVAHRKESETPLL